MLEIVKVSRITKCVWVDFEFISNVCQVFTNANIIGKHYATAVFFCARRLFFCVANSIRCAFFSHRVQVAIDFRRKKQANLLWNNHVTVLFMLLERWKKRHWIIGFRQLKWWNLVCIQNNTFKMCLINAHRIHT